MVRGGLVKQEPAAVGMGLVQTGSGMGEEMEAANAAADISMKDIEDFDSF